MITFKHVFLLTLAVITPLTHAREVTGIAAKVNGKVITKNEVNYHLTPHRQRLDASMPRKGAPYYDSLKKVRGEILDSLIERELILSEFHNRIKGKIPSHVIDSDINRQVRDLYNNNRNEYNKSLRQAGLTPQQHRRETEKKIIVREMRRQQFKYAVPPLPNEVAKEFNKHKLKMRDMTGDALEFHKIYIPKLDPNNALVTPKTQLQLAESIVTQLNEGANFSELAKKHSQDAWAADGGKVEKTNRTDLSPAFAAILMENPTGKILGPLETGGGFTIVRLDKKHYGPTPPLSKVRKAVEGRVSAQKNKSKHDRWMKRLRDNAMIERDDV